MTRPSTSTASSWPSLVLQPDELHVVDEDALALRIVAHPHSRANLRRPRRWCGSVHKRRHHMPLPRRRNDARSASVGQIAVRLVDRAHAQVHEAAFLLALGQEQPRDQAIAPRHKLHRLVRATILHTLGHEPELARVSRLLAASELAHVVLQPVAVTGRQRPRALLE